MSSVTRLLVRCVNERGPLTITELLKYNDAQAQLKLRLQCVVLIVSYRLD